MPNAKTGSPGRERGRPSEDPEREWRRTLDHLSEGDGITQQAAAELEALTMRLLAYRVQVKFAYVEASDGSFIDKDEFCSEPPIFLRLSQTDNTPLPALSPTTSRARVPGWTYKNSE
jgi:hypothetical protein